MANPSGLYLFSPNAPKGNQLFSLGDGNLGDVAITTNTSLNNFTPYMYRNLTINSAITVTQDINPNPPGRGGRGSLIILVQGTATITGSIDLNGKGYSGSIATINADGPGGGGGIGAGGETREGGGGGHANAGATGSRYNTEGAYVGAGGTGGPAYGNEDLFPIYMGSGGGNGYNTADVFQSGGAGGGAVILVARKIVVTGTISCNGTRPNWPSAGGSGGSILLIAPEVELGSSLVTAIGAQGSHSGHGSVGRIRLDYATKSGTTNPTAHEHSGLRVGYLKQFSISAGFGQVR